MKATLWFLALFGVAVAIATLLFRAMFGTIFLFLILMVLVWASWWVGDRK